MKRTISLILLILIICNVSVICAPATEQAVTLTPNRPPFTLTTGSSLTECEIFLDLDMDKINATQGTISDIKVTIEQPFSTGLITDIINPISLEFAKYIETIEIDREKSGIQQYKFKIRATTTEKASAGNYSIPINISYKYDLEDATTTANRSYSEQISFKVVSQPDNMSTKVNIKKFVISKDDEGSPIMPGDRFVAIAYLQNKGDFYIEDAKISLRNLTPDTFLCTNLGETKFIDIPDHQTTSALFELISSPNLPFGKYVLTVRLDYRDHNDVIRYEEAQTFITIGNEDGLADVDYSTPIMLIDSYSFGGNHVTGGQTFPLSMKFVNTNQHSLVDNIRVSITDQSGTFTPKRSSNTFYISDIKPGETASRTIEMFTDTSATPKPYQISVRYQYEAIVNGQRISYTEDELISIPLVQPEVLSVDTLIVPSSSSVGESVPIGATFINKGKSSLNNLTVTIEGDFKGSGQPYYIGSLSPGRTDSYDATIVPQNVGSIAGELVFKYDDFEGKPQEIRSPFEFISNDKATSGSVSKPEFTPPTLPKEDEDKNKAVFSLSQLPFTIDMSTIAIVAIVVFGIGLIWYSKKKKL